MQFSRLSRLFAASAMAVSAVFVLNACKEDEEVFPAPTASAGAEASGVPGAKVNVTASISAPAGLKTLTVLKNGAAFDTKTYTDGATSDNYSKEYTIESLASGTTVNFTVIATDTKNQASAPVTFTVKVTAVPPKQVVTVKGLLTGNISWTKDKIYKLSGFVRVGGDTTETAAAGVATGTLTIEAGTVIIGERSTKGTLIIQRGSKIIANGTASEPIVFTSERGVGEREAGDWGGLVICGKAKNNLPGGSAQLEGSYKGWHGGSDDADNSGSLKYVRVEYAGVPINPNQEINSFTFGSVGSGTSLEYLQASYGGDDSYEWFGGTVNAKYLVAYRGLDDDFDMDNGFRGNIQFAVGLRGATSADQSGSNGFEVDNDGQGTSAEPFTSPTLANVSLIGAKQSQETFISTLFQNGMHLRRNNKIKVYNTFVTGYPNGVYIDGSTTAANAVAGSLVLNNVVLAGVTGWGTNGYGQGAATQPQGFAVRDVNTSTPAAALTIGTQKPSEWFASLAGNKTVASWTTTGISNTVFGAGRPTFTITTSATDAITKGTSTVTLPAFFTATDYVGAFKDTDWTATWAEFNPSAVVYIK
ncbi:cell shape-determining protein MreB [Emticicia sp. TH156]|uniref:cell shape-determining protein MreB n=1 Tax=Emticicia sp. TH156 TaxID=2067454 RepID=UPI000C75749A|nr:cell shape-determining protein MreB [Emticicia sp. TH156]PLK43890.1 cell shape-determining protein MreB [Emticicia sp. TH156]